MSGLPPNHDREDCTTNCYFFVLFDFFSFVSTDMGNAAAAQFGLPEPPVTLKQSVDGLTKVVCSRSSPFFFLFLSFLLEGWKGGGGFA